MLVHIKFWLIHIYRKTCVILKCPSKAFFVLRSLLATGFQILFFFPVKPNFPTLRILVGVLILPKQIYLIFSPNISWIGSQSKTEQIWFIVGEGENQTIPVFKRVKLVNVCRFFYFCVWLRDLIIKEVAVLLLQSFEQQSVDDFRGLVSNSLQPKDKQLGAMLAVLCKYKGETDEVYLFHLHFNPAEGLFEFLAYT